MQSSFLLFLQQLKPEETPWYFVELGVLVPVPNTYPLILPLTMPLSHSFAIYLDKIKQADPFPAKMKLQSQYLLI